MRTLMMAFILIGCGDTTTQPPQPTPDMAMATLPNQTVNNTLAWCTVTVTVPGSQPVMFSSSSHVFDVASGTTVMLHAVPNPSFKPVKWTGVTTMNGADATYDLTAAAMQTVTACCPLSDGSGC